MNLFYQIFFIFAFYLILALCSSNLSDTKCRYDNVTLECYGNHSLPVEYFPIPVDLQPFQQLFNHKISKLNLKYVSLEAVDLDKFDSLKTLELSEESNEYLDENIFTPKLGSTLLELQLHGSYLFSSTAFKHLKNLTSLIFIVNFKLEPMLSKEFFSDSLSNLKFLEISFCGISSIDGDMFINLKNLETLKLYFNSIKEFPKAIQYIPSLKNIIVGNNELEVLKKPFTTILPNLEFIELSHSQSLIAIEDCAFCNFPNLKSIYLANSEDLTWIHENAFGDLLPFNNEYWGHKVENLETFNIVNCNVSVLPEHLLNWSKMKYLNLGGNKFICNCSNAWLIEDIQSNNSIFSDNLKRHLYFRDKSELECDGPEDVKGKFLIDISTRDCKKMVFANLSGAFWVFTGFLLVVALMIIITVIIFRQRIIEFYESSKSNIDLIKLNEYNDS